MAALEAKYGTLCGVELSLPRYISLYTDPYSDEVLLRSTDEARAAHDEEASAELKHIELSRTASASREQLPLAVERAGPQVTEP